MGWAVEDDGDGVVLSVSSLVVGDGVTLPSAQKK